MRPLLPALLSLALFAPGCLVGSDGVNNPQPGKDPCTSNPCTEGDKTTCANNNGQAQCLCKPGTLPRPNGSCEPLSAANCPEHAGDAAEPDDCLGRAAALTPGPASPARSISPVGDYDFFRIDGAARSVYVVSVEPGTGALLPRLDVFDAQGQWVAAQDGQPKASLGFKLRGAAPYYVRVSHSPRDPSAATGAYSLSLGEPVVDDHGDSVTEATTLTPSPGGSSSPTVITGRFEYGQDDDYFAFPVVLNATYRVEFDTGTGRVVPALAAFIREDVKTPFRTAQNAFVEFRASSSTTVYLDLYPPQGTPGTYALRVLEYR